MEKQQKIVILTTAVLIMLSVDYVHADPKTSADKLNDCMDHLIDAKEYVNTNWDRSQTQSLCVQLMNGETVTIYREEQRDIVIIMVNVGDHVTVPSLE